MFYCHHLRKWVVLGPMGFELFETKKGAIAFSIAIFTVLAVCAVWLLWICVMIAMV